MKNENKKIDAFREFVNIGVGKSAECLNKMFSSHISLNIPEIDLLQNSQTIRIKEINNCSNYSSVAMAFNGDLHGRAFLIFTSNSVNKLVSCLMDIDPDSLEFKNAKTGVVTEIGNIVINSLVGSISNILQINIDYLMPKYKEGKLNIIIDRNIPELSTSSLCAHTCFNINTLTQVRHLPLKKSYF